MTDTELQLIADSVREYVDEKIRAVRDPLLREIEALQRELRDLTPAHDGKDADPELMRQSIIAEVSRQVAELPPAKDGAPGADVNMADVESRIDASVAIAVAAIPLPKDGKNGADGQRGEPGPAGPAGESVRGERGEVGPQGKSGEAGPPGHDGESIKGERGESGANGKDGAPGRDALQVEFLSSLDRTKSAPRGTIARRHGGVWRAFRDTDSSTDGDGPLETFGWECIWDGLADIAILHNDDLRSFAIQTTLSSGKSTAAQFRIPVPLDRGVFKDGTSYERGDTVTWDGSGWICQAESTTDKPGISKDWRLSVKRGQPGKDFRPPEKPPNSGPIKI